MLSNHLHFHLLTGAIPLCNIANNGGAGIIHAVFLLTIYCEAAVTSSKILRWYKLIICDYPFLQIHQLILHYSHLTLQSTMALPLPSPALAKADQPLSSTSPGLFPMGQTLPHLGPLLCYSHPPRRSWGGICWPALLPTHNTLHLYIQQPSISQSGVSEDMMTCRNSPC